MKTSLLQGGHGRIDLADVAGQVQVFTKDFLEDIAATTTAEAFLFSATTQTYFDNVNGNADSRPGSRNTSNNGSKYRGPVDPVRIRKTEYLKPRPSPFQPVPILIARRPIPAEVADPLRRSLRRFESARPTFRRSRTAEKNGRGRKGGVTLRLRLDPWLALQVCYKV